MCLFYSTTDALLGVQLPYFLQGIRQHQACVWLVNRPLEVATVLGALSAELHDLEALTSRGQVVVLEASQHYRGGTAAAAVEFWAAHESLCRKRGFGGLRISGNVHGNPAQQAWRALMEYERDTDALIHERNIISLCCYEALCADAAKVAEVVSIHQGCLVQRGDGWELIPNHEYDVAADRAQRQLSELESIYAHAPIGLSILDPELRWQRVNTLFAEMNGFVPAQLIGRSLREVLPDVADKAEPRLRRSLETGEPVLDLEINARAPDRSGVVRSWMENFIPFKDSYGGILGINWVCEDVTERKRQEQARESMLETERAARSAAERANRTKDDFLATVSHELRTPLNAILGWAQLLMGKASSVSDEFTPGLEVILRNAKMQAKLIEDLLDVSRIISGKIQLNLQLTSPAEFIVPAVESLRQAAEAKDLEIESAIDVRSGTAPVRGDAARLQQVMWNLLSNAVKFTQGPATIKVAARRLADTIEIAVSDRGEGIDPDFLPLIFERFCQADSSTTRRHKGLGIGLSLVKHIVQMHGGRVKAESLGKGQGASFVVELPVAAGAHAKADGPPMHAAELAAANALPIRVLVVDDEPDAVELLKRILSQSGAIVFPSSSAEEALEIVKQCAPDVIVSDIGMPGQDGYAFMQSVRQLAGCQGGQTPAVAVTAFVRGEDKARALAAGFQAHISKPIEAHEIVSVVARLAENRSAVDALAPPHAE